MKCDQFVSSLATGGSFRRWRARLHAARCPRCAELREQLRDIARELAEAPALTAAQRALWSAASVEESRPSSTRMRMFRPYLAAAGVLVILAMIAAWAAWMRPRQDGGREMIATERPSAKPKAEWNELLITLRADADRLGRELLALRHQADLMDVRKDADALWARYAIRGPSRVAPPRL